MDSHEPYFRGLFDKYKGPLHDYIRAITHSHEVAEDIVQEIFIRLWRNKDRLHEVENMDGFIFRIARNETIDYFKKLALDARLTKDLIKRIKPSMEGPQELLDASDAARVLDNAIATLSPQRQKVYRLSRQQGLNIEEIAEELKLSYSTVKNTLVEALRQIREFISAHYPLSLGCLFLFWP